MAPVRRTLALAVAILLLGQVVAAPASAAAASDGLDPDSVLLHVALQRTGDADWHIEYRYRLDDANETAAFESLRADVETDPEAYETRFRERLRETVAVAQNQTGRPMRLGAVTVSARTQTVPQKVGIVSYRVRWHGFAAVTGDTLDVGDALNGFYLAPTTTLSLGWPAAYTLVTVTPSPDTVEATRVTWTGERQFVGDDPSLVLTAATPATETDHGTGTGTAVDPRRAGLPGGPLGPLGSLGVGVVLAAVGAAVVLRRRRGVPETALRSDEERVHEALVAAGGRMRQQELAATYDWTASKTSKVISRMQEAEAVKVFRLGRENVVTLPEEGLDDA